MLRPRIAPCLLIRKGGLVKTVQLRDDKYVGDPINAVKIFNEKEADELGAKISAAPSETERDKLVAQQKTALAQARPPAPSETAQFGNTLTVPTGTGMWNFLALTFCLMVGTVGLPHILIRYYTVPNPKQARMSVGWSLLFIYLLYFTAPAYAAFARFALYTRLVGTKMSELPSWVNLWKPAGLFDVVDKNGDGIVQWADFVLKSSDFVVLATPEIAGLPFVITGLVMAGGLAAALSTADGLLLMASEVGVVDLAAEAIVEKGRLGPGQMIAVDTDQGVFLRNEEIKRELAV